MKRNICGIYMIKNMITKKGYIGYSNHTTDRWRQHRNQLKLGTHTNYHLQNSYNLYGNAVFKFYILEECTKEKLLERETYWIQHYSERTGVYNLKHEVPIPKTFRMSNEGREKIRIARYGTLHSEETKKKISESLTGRTLSNIHKIKIGISNTGKKRSKETKERLRETMKGKVPWINGKRHTEETKKKLSGKRLKENKNAKM